MIRGISKSQISNQSILEKLVANQDAIAKTLESINKLMLCAIGTPFRNQLKTLAINMVNESAFADSTKETFIYLAETSASVGELCHS